MIEFPSKSATSFSLRRHQNFIQISSLSRVSCSDISSALFICTLRYRNVVGRSKSFLWPDQWLFKWQQALSVFAEKPPRQNHSKPWFGLQQSPSNFWGAVEKYFFFSPASVMGLFKASVCVFSGCWSVSEALRLTWHLVEWLCSHHLHTGLTLHSLAYVHL